MLVVVAQPNGNALSQLTYVKLILTFVAFSIFLPASARADFLNYYTVQNFTLTNTNADGSAVSSDGGLSLDITGGNNGTGTPGQTDFVIAAAMAGVVQFQYSFATLDDPGFDSSGLLVDGVYSEFLNPTGTVVLPVTLGQVFGFRLTTADNTGEPGILSISDFSAPEASTSVPEPNFGGPVLLCFGAIALRVRRSDRLFATVRRSSFKPLFTLVAGVAISMNFLALAQNQTSYGGTDITGQLTRTAVVNARQAASAVQSLATGNLGPEFDPKAKRPIHPPVIQRLLATSIPAMQSLPVTSTTTGVSFPGLTHYDQRQADQGNQLSVEPPNQSLAVANGYVLEGVNNAVQVYSTSGTPLLPAVLTSNRLFGLPPALNRSTSVFGPFPTDMRVFYDQTIDRWFVLQRAQDKDVFGTYLNSSHLYVAVSQTGDPTGNYNIYTMDTTNAQHFGCPCFADYPQIGADQFGFYISTNEYDTTSSQFLDVRILAISKASLASGAVSPPMYNFFVSSTSGYEFAVQPAMTPPGASYFIAAGGVEFLASTQSSYSSDGNLAIWALSNTASLGVGHPNLTLVEMTVPVLPYISPDVATQRPGPLPYGSTLGGSLAFLDGGDTRVQSLVYAGGRLYATFAAKVFDEDGRALVGGAYAILSPTFRAGTLASPVLRQGYLMVRSNHLLRPAVAVNGQGNGAIVFTLAGPDYYPSAAFVPLSTFSTGSAVQIAIPGVAPEDGFTGYQSGFGTGLARWGDYSTAVASADNAVWMTTEYIPNAPRTTVANWGSSVTRVKP